MKYTALVTIAIKNFPSTLSSLTVQRLQRLLKVGPEVLHVLDPDTQPDQILRNAERLGRVPASAFNQRFDPPRDVAGSQSCNARTNSSAASAPLR